MADTWNDFTTRMFELRDLSGVIGLLNWDQETFMPPKAGESRAQQLATMQGLYHERLTAPALGEVVEKLRADKTLDEAKAAMVRNLGWERDRAVKVPARLVRELAERQSMSVEAWRGAREKRDFSLFRPHLDALVKLKREQADALGFESERYDALLENFEPGMRASRLEPLFKALRAELVPLVRAIGESKRRPDVSFLAKSYDLERQWTFTMKLLEDLGFDLQAGRQDKSTHPFTGGAGHPSDVRLTTRLFANNPISGIMSTVHECGHGLYEQGYAPEHVRTTVATAPSMGLHESQSRFWENVIGRSLPFWRNYFPLFQKQFPNELAGVTAEQFHAAVNLVEPSLIRVEADEVTYNLHILVRFELELMILRGKAEAKDLPELWNGRMQEFLGLRPSHDTEGVMQDIHWAWGEFGYFPTYSLGNLYSAMFLDAMQKDLPVWEHAGRGELKPILGWLREKVHRKGFLYPAEELAKKVTGQALTEKPFVSYLWQKYGPLYGVSR